MVIIFNFQLILRLPQVLEDQLHLPTGQSARGTLVAHTLQLREQAVGRGDVLVQQAQGRGARCAREVELGELALGERGGRPTPNPSLYGGELADIDGAHGGYRFSFRHRFRHR